MGPDARQFWGTMKNYNIYESRLHFCSNALRSNIRSLLCVHLCFLTGTATVKLLQVLVFIYVAYESLTYTDRLNEISEVNFTQVRIHSSPFLADHSARNWSAIGIIMSSIRPSVCDAKWYIHTPKSVRSFRIGSAHRKTILQLSTSTPTLSLKTLHLLNLLNRRRWRHLAKKLTGYCELASRQNFNFWRSHRQHVARLY